jgi:hypothetical protein
MSSTNADVRDHIQQFTMHGEVWWALYWSGGGPVLLAGASDA